MKRSVQVFIIFFVVCLFLNSFQSTAQQPNSLIQITGHVYSADSLIAIPYTTIINKQTHTRTTCDDKGYFSMQIRPSDTLIFSAIGFESFNLVISEAAVEKRYFKVMLQPRTYELDAIRITGYKTFSQFKKDFVDLKLPEEPHIYIPSVSHVYTGNTTPTLTMKGPFSFMYDKFSKRAHEQKKVLVTQKQNELNRQAHRKYNKDFVASILNINGPELDEFMSFCKLSNEYVAATSEYDLIAAVKHCYNSFKSRQPESADN